MDYLDATTAACVQLASETSGEGARAALRLALLPWSTYVDANRWERLALDLLEADDHLSSLPSSVVVCGPPDPDDPQVVVAVRSLAQALATNLDALAADDARDLEQRLACDAAAAQVRRAAARLA